MGTMSMNQFGLSVKKGQVDLRSGQPTLSVQIDSSEAGTLVPGQAVKIVDSKGGIPKVIAAAADTDDVFGFIVIDLKTPSYVAGDRIEIVSGRSGFMYMEAGAAVARGAKVQIVVAGQKVITAVSTKRIVGSALDKAAASGDIIRVSVDLPGAIAP